MFDGRAGEISSYRGEFKPSAILRRWAKSRETHTRTRARAHVERKREDSPDWDAAAAAAAAGLSDVKRQEGAD